MPTLPFLLSILLLVLPACREKPAPPFSEIEITGQELGHHIRYLASDELGGRRAGTEGAERAGRYIAGEFQRYGLRPAGDEGGWTQPFTFLAGPRMGEGNRLSVTHVVHTVPLNSGMDYLPLTFSSNAAVTGYVIFAGYGIIAPALGYNDYDGVDATGKIVLILRHTPDGTADYGDFAAYRTLRYKIMTAREQGAVGVLFATGPQTQGESEMIPFRQDMTPTHSGLPAMSVSQKTADRLFSDSGTTLQEAQATINRTRKGKPFLLSGVQISMQTDVVIDRQQAVNVLGWIPGTDETLRDQVIVVGAHYDHLGESEERPPGAGRTALHPGADDNASGTAGLLELAQIFAAPRFRPKRSLLFIAFSAEERGLVGSRYYVEHPFIPLTQTVAMINLDMIGRLRNGALTVRGVGTGQPWEQILRRNGRDVFDLKLEADGAGPSDHASFYDKDIPVLFFYTGNHPDYHRPSDTAEKINVDGEKTIVEYVYRVLMDIQQAAERPAFVQAAASKRSSSNNAKD